MRNLHRRLSRLEASCKPAGKIGWENVPDLTTADIVARISALLADPSPGAIDVAQRVAELLMSAMP
jgi:hypothetical protein